MTSINPFEALRPTTLAAIVADIDANLELVPSNKIVERFREACYTALCDNWGPEKADAEIARIIAEEF